MSAAIAAAGIGFGLGVWSLRAFDAMFDRNHREIQRSMLVLIGLLLALVTVIAVDESSTIHEVEECFTPPVERVDARASER